MKKYISLLLMLSCICRYHYTDAISRHLRTLKYDGKTIIEQNQASFREHSTSKRFLKDDDDEDSQLHISPNNTTNILIPSIYPTTSPTLSQSDAPSTTPQTIAPSSFPSTTSGSNVPTQSTTIPPDALTPYPPSDAPSISGLASNIPTESPTFRPSIDFSAIYAEIARENGVSYYTPEPTYAFTIDVEPETIIVTDDEILLLGRRESLATTEAFMWTFGMFGLSMCLLYTNRKKIYRLKRYLDGKLGDGPPPPGTSGLRQNSTHSMMGLMDDSTRTSQDDQQSTHAGVRLDSSSSTAAAVANVVSPLIDAQAIMDLSRRKEDGSSIDQIDNEVPPRSSPKYERFIARTDRFMDTSAHNIGAFRESLSTLSGIVGHDPTSSTSRSKSLIGQLPSLDSPHATPSPPNAVVTSFPPGAEMREELVEPVEVPRMDSTFRPDRPPPVMPARDTHSIFAPSRWMSKDED